MRSALIARAVLALALVLCPLVVALPRAEGQPAFVFGGEGLDFPRTTLALSPDGKLLATADFAGAKAQVLVIDVATRKHLRRLECASAYLNQIVFSPDGRRLYAGGKPGATWSATPGRKLLIWESQTGKKLADLETDGWDLSADGELLVTLENAAVIPRDDGEQPPPPAFTIRFRGGASGKELRNIREKGTSIASLRLSPDGKLLALADKAFRVRLLDTATGKEVRNFMVPRDKYDDDSFASITHLAWSGDSRTLATVKDAANFFDDKHRRLTLWDARTGKEKRQIPPPHSHVSGLEFARQQHRLVVTMRGGGWAVYDTQTGDVLRAPKGRQLPGGVALAFYRHYVGPDDAKVGPPLLRDLWDNATGADVESGRQVDRFFGLGVSPDGKLLATGEQNGRIRLLDTSTGKQLRHFSAVDESGHSSSVFHLAFTPSSKLLVTGDWDGTVHLWDVATGEQLGAAMLGSGATIQGLAFTKDGRLAVATYRQLFLGKIEDNRFTGMKRVLSTRGSWTGVRFTADGESLFIGDWLTTGKDSVRQFDLRLGKVVRTILPPGEVPNFEVSPDGKKVFTLSRGTPINRFALEPFLRVWDAKTGAELKNLTLTVAPFYGLRFAPDGRLAVQHQNGTGLWDPETGRGDAFFGPGKLAAFSADGHRAYCFEDKRVTGWNVPAAKKAPERKER